MKNILLALSFLCFLAMQANAQTVNIQPGDATICNGESLALSYSQIGLTEPITCEWDLGNGVTLSDCSITYTYPLAGTYTTCITLTDANQVEIQDCATITVTSDIVVNHNDFQKSCYPMISVVLYPNYTFQWSNGWTGEQTSGLLPAGAYTVTITDNNVGCLKVENIVIDELDYPTIIEVIGTNPTTCMSNDGSIEAIVTGGVPPYTYKWWNLYGLVVDGEVTSKIENLGDGVFDIGTYQVEVTDSNGCSVMGTGSLGNNIEITDITIVPEVGCDDYVSVTILPDSYQYSWENGAIGNVQNNFPISQAHDYPVTVYNGEGCQLPLLISYDYDEAMSIMGDVTHTTCGSPVPDGAITIEVINGSGNYTYEWSNGALSATITGLDINVYEVTVTDSDSGCTETAVFSLTDVLPEDITSDVTHPTCGQADGEITILLDNSAGNYTYSWFGLGATGPTVTNLAAGSYNVVVTNTDIACNEVVTFVLEDEIVPAQLITITNGPSAVICENEATPLNLDAGPGYLSYEWNTGATTQLISTEIQGTYAVTVEDAGGCYYSDFVDVIVDEALTVEIVSPNSVCEFENFSMQCVGSGDPNETYAWEGEGLFTFTGDYVVAFALDAGTYDYTVTITNGNGCTSTDVKTVTTNPTPEAEITPIAPICIGESTSLTAVGPVGTYQWTGGNLLTVIIEGETIFIDGDFLLPGDYDYSLTVTDTNGCIGTTNYVVTVNDCTPEDTYIVAGVGETISNIPFAGLDITGNIIFELEDGGLQAISSYGNYTLDPLTGALTYNAGSIAGAFIDTILVVAVNDNNEQDFSRAIISIEDSCDQADHEVVNVIITEATCGQADGDAEIIITGSYPPYTFEWPNGATSPILTGLAAGVYTVTITDVNACSITSTLVVGDLGEPEASVNFTAPATCDSSDGAVEILPSNYICEWGDGSTGCSRNDLESGVYSVTITDPTIPNCPNQIEVIIPAANNLTVTFIDVINPACEEANGSATISAVNGSGTYSYLWETGGTDVTYTDLAAGTYQVTVTDMDTGCEVEEILVLEGEAITPVNIFVTTGVIYVCEGASDGFLGFSVEPSLGITTTIEDTEGNIYQNGTLPEGYYIIKAYDENGCLAAETNSSVSSYGVMTIDLEGMNPSACGLFDGSIDATVAGGGGDLNPYTYTWSNGMSTEDITGLNADTYTVTVVSYLGCEGIQEITLADIEVEIPEESTIVLCPGETTTLTAAENGDTYLWSGGGATSQSINTGTAGNYIVTITDASGCTGTQSFIVEEVDECVWPGDANYDGLANNQDILFLGMAYGNTGQARTNPSIDWEGQPAPFEWDSIFMNGINQKHADSDGNGIVEHDDTTAIVENYNLPPHDLRTPTADGENILHVDFNTATADYEEYVELKVNLADVNVTIPEAYGLAFSLAFNHPEVIKPESIQVDFGNSVFGSETETISLFKFLMAEGRMDFAITRFDHVGLTDLEGEVVTVGFIIEDNIDGFAPAENYILNASVTNILCIKPFGEEVILTGGASELTMLESNAVSDWEGIAPVLDYYPNPTQEVLYLDMKGGATIQQLRVFDTLGRLIEEESGNDIKEIRTEQWKAGMYFFEITDDSEQQYLLKIVKE